MTLKQLMNCLPTNGRCDENCHHTVIMFGFSEHDNKYNELDVALKAADNITINKT